MYLSETLHGLVSEDLLNHLRNHNEEDITEERIQRFFGQCVIVYELLTGGEPNIPNLETFSYLDPSYHKLCIEFLSTLSGGQELIISIFEESDLLLDTEILLAVTGQDHREGILSISTTFVCTDSFPYPQGLTLELIDDGEAYQSYVLRYDSNGAIRAIGFSDPKLREALKFESDADPYTTITHPTDMSITISYLNELFGDIILPMPIDVWGTLQYMVQGLCKSIGENKIPVILYK